MSIFSNFRNSLKALTSSNALTQSQARNYVDFASGVTERTISNTNKHLLEIAEYVKSKDLKLRINRCDEDVVVLSVKEKANDNKFLVCNAFKADKDKHPLIFNIMKTIDEAIAGLQKQREKTGQ